MKSITSAPICAGLENLTSWPGSSTRMVPGSRPAMMPPSPSSTPRNAGGMRSAAGSTTKPQQHRGDLLPHKLRVMGHVEPGKAQHDRCEPREAANLARRFDTQHVQHV